jgi:hypothetical protein
MSETASAAEAAFTARMSVGFCWSTASAVTTTWTSWRKPSGNEGLIGRSISRAFKIAFSVARPSRRKNPPGILPAAYIRSSTSTVSGKKSPSPRGSEDVAAVMTVVSPIEAMTAPFA